MEIKLILMLILGWIIVGAIIGSFGTNRKIGFVRTYFAALLLSPILAMLFVLASDKVDKPNHKGIIAVVGIPIIILFIILRITIVRENVEAAESFRRSMEYDAKQIQESITIISNLPWTACIKWEHHSYYRHEIIPITYTLPLDFQVQMVILDLDYEIKHKLKFDGNVEFKTKQEYDSIKASVLTFLGNELNIKRW
jgi:hypothetical protein